MLKLTHYSNPHGPVYIAPQFITSIEPGLDDRGCSVFTSGGKSYFIRETAEQILAMEQMVLLFNPAMIISGDQVRRL